MNFIHRAMLFSMLAVLASASRPLARAQEPAAPSEYELKAAFLYNFAKFVEWPSQVFPDPTAPFTIGIIGEDPFGDALEATVRNKTINGRQFVIKKTKSYSEFRTCQILFISSSERRRVADLLKALSGDSVLTVSEMDRFIQAGGMINFFMEGNKVRFEINPEPAKHAGLRISSKLLNLAKRPEREGNK